MSPFLPGHLPGTVDVVWLHVLGEPVLGHQVKLDHGVGEGLGEDPEGGDHPEHGPVEGAVDLLEGGLAGVVNIHHGHVTQEPGGSTLA